MAITHMQITNAKARSKPYSLTDREALYLVVRKSGAKLWRMNYRYLGRQKTLHLGSWPTVGIAAAREKRDEAKRLLASGLDPAAEKRAQLLVRKVSGDNCFKMVAQEWVSKNEREGLAPVTLDKIRWLLDIAYPMIGSRPVSHITPQEVLAVLRKVESRGRYESARRMRSVVSRVFRYAIATARTDRDVAADLRGAITTPRVRHLSAITTPSEAARLMRAIESYRGRDVTCLALRLSPHLFVRPGELRNAEWSEIDQEAALWSLPAHKTKMRRPHRVPLSRQVLDLLDQLYGLTGHRAYLFPCLGSPKQCMSENTVNDVLRRLGFGRSEMTAHGFRAMAATLLNEMGIWNPDAIERQLGHLDTSMVRRAYTRGEYWDERVRMMQYWSDYLDMLRDGATVLRPTFGARRELRTSQHLEIPVGNQG